MVQIWGPIVDTFKTVLMGGSKDGVISGVEVDTKGQVSVTDADTPLQQQREQELQATVDDLVVAVNKTNEILAEAFETQAR